MKLRMLFLLGAALVVVSLTGCGGGGGGGDSDNPVDPVDPVDTVAPAVVATSPVNNSSDAAVNHVITATFSEVLNPGTVNTQTFTLKKNGVTPVTGSVSYSGTSAVFDPSANLEAGTSYTATISSGVKDLAGNALSGNHTWQFSTASIDPVDTLSPAVFATNPANNSSDVAVNRDITAAFSEVLNPGSVNTQTFTLKKNGVTPVTGSVSYSGTSAVFDPSANLEADTSYTATLSSGVKDLAGNALTGGYTWQFSTAGVVIPGDTTPPTVDATSPANNSSDVAVNRDITAAFSEVLNPGTVNAQTFTLKKNGTIAVSGSISYSGTSAVFNPSANLEADTSYTATISSGVKDLAGNALVGGYTWHFTTAAVVIPGDTIPPTVLTTFPVKNAVDVSVQTTVVATFSEVLNPSTINTQTFTLKKNGVTAVGGVTSYTGTSAIFTPGAALESSTSYTATLSSAVKDLAGNALAGSYSWTFTTVAQQDTVAPLLLDYSPLNNAQNVPLDTPIVVRYNEPIRPFAFGQIDGNPVEVTFNATYTTVTLQPTEGLLPNQTYQATISVRDMAGNWSVPFTWSFRTAIQ